MIRLGLRFSLRGAREGKIRLVLTTLGVALAVTLLLLTLSGFNGLGARDLHSGWLLTSGTNSIPSVDESSADPLWWRISTEVYDTRYIRVVEVAATGPRSPLPPGIDRLPAPGEYYVSPALATLLAETPHDLLGARFAGTQVGILGRAALTSPASLLMIAGRPAEQMEQSGTAVQVRSIEMAPEPHSYSYFFRIALGIGAIGLMLPVLVFVITSTRLAAARREERLAALRLVGATPRQINVIAAVEAMLAAAGGTALGFVLFFAFRPLAARIPFTGEPFFTSDLHLGWLALAGVAAGVPVAAIGASMWTLRRVQISPLGVSRKAPARRPRSVRVLVPVLALGLLALPNFLSGSTARTFLVFIVFAAIALGIILVGPWLTYLGGRALARVARRDSTLIAARRLGTDPRRAFRAISGLVLAVFMGTVFVVMLGTAIDRGTGSFKPRDLPALTVVQDFQGSRDGYVSPEQSARLVAQVKALPGVQAVIPVLASPGTSMGIAGSVTDQQWLLLGGDPERLDGSGRVILVPNDLGMGELLTVKEMGGSTGLKGAPDETGIDSQAPPTLQLVVLTDGTIVSAERVRTTLELASPNANHPYTITDVKNEANAFFRVLERMIDVGIILCLVIAGCSLAVSVAGGLVERKRAFALLRLTGMPLRNLYRSVLLEAAVPLMLAAFVSALVGFLVAALILWNTGGGFSVAAPAPSYYGLVIGGLLAALGIVAATLPLVGRMTGPENARME